MEIPREDPVRFYRVLKFYVKEVRWSRKLDFLEIDGEDTLKENSLYP